MSWEEGTFVLDEKYVPDPVELTERESAAILQDLVKKGLLKKDEIAEERRYLLYLNLNKDS